MPVYTYACDACGAQLERRQSFSDARLTVCEACGSSLRKILHPVGVIFKGSGFYNTDYKKSSGNGSNKDGAEKPKDGASDGAKVDDGKKSEPAKAKDSKPASTPSKTESGSPAAAASAAD